MALRWTWSTPDCTWKRDNHTGTPDINVLRFNDAFAWGTQRDEIVCFDRPVDLHDCVVVKRVLRLYVLWWKENNLDFIEFVEETPLARIEVEVKVLRSLLLSCAEVIRMSGVIRKPVAFPSPFLDLKVITPVYLWSLSDILMLELP